MISAVVDFKNRIKNRLWMQDLSKLPLWQALLLKSLRIFYVVGRHLVSGRLTLHAMGLVYTTLLSLVPLLALSFSVLKGFGVHNQLEPMLLNFLAPFGAKGIELTSQLVGFVDNLKVGVLGSMGLVLLLYTVLSMIQKVERSFNMIWQVNRSRGIARRFSDYLSVLFIGPMFLFAALGLMASLMSSAMVGQISSIESLGQTVQFFGKLVPYLIVIGVFSFIYSFIPNTKVHLSAAVVGGVFSGILWQSAGWVFASFIVTSTKYVAIYSGFAILILFLIWLYLCWLILLTGASISFYWQYPDKLENAKDAESPIGKDLSAIALLIMGEVAKRFDEGQRAADRDDLVSTYGIGGREIDITIDALRDSGLVLEVSDEDPQLVLARAADQIQIIDILNCVTPGEYGSHQGISMALAVDRLLIDKREAISCSLQGKTLGDLLKSSRNETLA